ncbi:MAG: proline dehydrogenase [Crocinitomicaceae bacterium]|nr:proline dehydrogenase [Crocinitomicaceae bacterium]|tara:strand:+ start:9034 stop:10212 length:1179 start_codon:yes stop_codon:yes gene_type:complete
MSLKGLPNFDNTELAFRHLSDRDLKRGRVLFELLSRPWLVDVGSLFARLALALRIPIGWAIRPTVYAQFCGGETIEESEETVELLYKNRVRTILDYSAEGVTSEEELDSNCSEILATIDAAREDPRHAFSVFKPSGLSLKGLLSKSTDDFTIKEEEEWERVLRRIRTICQATSDAGGKVLIDAEESWLQDNIDEIAEDMMSDYNRESVIVYTTVQLYRIDRLKYLKNLCIKARECGFKIGVKLVRGAYMEKERAMAIKNGCPLPIQPNKEATDRDFDNAIRFCLDNLDAIHIFAGTHNAESTLMLCKEMSERGIENDDPRISFSQLLGMSDQISFNLAAHGYNIAKYVPYGPIREAIPYLIRRAKENTSIEGQTSRELSLIDKELKRRKKLI